MEKSLETITSDNVLELNDELSILVIGMSKSGKTSLIKRIIDDDIKDNLYLDFNKEFWEFTEDDSNKYLKVFKENYIENCNIYIDDVRSDLKNALMNEYFTKKGSFKNPNRLVVTFESFDEIQALNLIEHFDVILLGKTNCDYPKVINTNLSFELNHQIIALSHRLNSGQFLLCTKTYKSIFSFSNILRFLKILKD